MPRSDWYADTDPRALAVYIECQRRMSASEKLQAILGWNRMLFEMTRAVIDPAGPLIRLLEALDRLGIQYLIGGSVASGIHGIFSATADVKLVAGIRPPQASLVPLNLTSFLCRAILFNRASSRAGRSPRWIWGAARNCACRWPAPRTRCS